MTDIVERLQARKGFWLNGANWMMGTAPDPDCVEAADEIMRLRAKLADIANSMERDWQDPTEHANWCIEHAKT